MDVGVGDGHHAGVGGHGDGVLRGTDELAREARVPVERPARAHAVGECLPVHERHHVVNEIIPLFHGVTLVRALTTGVIEPRLAWDVLYLVVFCGICLFIAMRQIERKLIK